MNDERLKQLCISLINADSEEGVIELLSTEGFWENEEVWRDFGDLENNFSTIGNQASRPETALAEKLVNSVDAQLTRRCYEEDIELEGERAPQSSREAVAMFFAPWNPNSVRAGYINEWPVEHRLEIARGISLAVTGSSPREGNPSITVADSGEGQVPREFPNTFMSLHRSNKLRIPFVQGKFNMGGLVHYDSVVRSIISNLLSVEETKN